MPLSANIETLARALDPEAFAPHPDWYARHERAVGQAVSMISGSATDHLAAAFALMLASQPTSRTR